MSGKIDSNGESLKNTTKTVEIHSREIENLKTDLNILRTGNHKELAALNKESALHKIDIKNSKNDVNRLSKEVKSLKEDKLIAYRKIIDLESRSRRNNLLFFGIEESADEKPEEKVMSFIKDKLKIDTEKTVINFNRCHRLGAPRRGFIGSRAHVPRPIIVNFCDYKVKELVRSERYALKAPYGMANDLPTAVRKAQQSLLGQLKELKKTEPRSAIVYPCKLISKGEVKAELDVAEFFNA